MYEHIFFPARMQPPHIGHISVIKKAIDTTYKLTILIYETEKKDQNNPFDGEEIKFMIQNSLDYEELEKVEIILMPYFENISDRYQFVEDNTELDIGTLILTDSKALVGKYESQGYEVINPHELIKDNIKAKIRGTTFRELILSENNEWEKYAAKGTLIFNKEKPLKDIISKYNTL
jgi:nicotinamide mononucleotide adenylyltransferase